MISLIDLRKIKTLNRFIKLINSVSFAELLIHYHWYRNKYYLLSWKSGKFKNSPSLFHFIFTLRELPGPDKLASQCKIAGLFRTTTTSSGSWRNLNSLNLWSNFRKEPEKQKKKHFIRCFHTLHNACCGLVHIRIMNMIIS